MPVEAYGVDDGNTYLFEERHRRRRVDGHLGPEGDDGSYLRHGRGEEVAFKNRLRGESKDGQDVEAALFQGGRESFEGLRLPRLQAYPIKIDAYPRSIAAARARCVGGPEGIEVLVYRPSVGFVKPRFGQRHRCAYRQIQGKMPVQGEEDHVLNIFPYRRLEVTVHFPS